MDVLRRIGAAADIEAGQDGADRRGGAWAGVVTPGLSGGIMDGAAAQSCPYAAESHKTFCPDTRTGCPPQRRHNNRQGSVPGICSPARLQNGKKR
jgi:hypothetical protein